MTPGCVPTGRWWWRRPWWRGGGGGGVVVGTWAWVSVAPLLAQVTLELGGDGVTAAQLEIGLGLVELLLELMDVRAHVVVALDGRAHLLPPRRRGRAEVAEARREACQLCEAG